jgi:hypothetical protein
MPERHTEAGGTAAVTGLSAALPGRAWNLKCLAGMMSIATRFTLVFSFSLALIAGAFYLILNRVYLGELKSQAATVADNVDAFGTWVAQYGRVWVKEDDRSYLGHLPLLQADEGATGAPGALKTVNFYSKNPALAQREFSEVVARSGSPAKFRLTSHNVHESQQRA